MVFLHQIEPFSNPVFLIIHYQQRGFRRVKGVDCRFMAIPIGAAVVPKSFVIKLVLVA